MSSKRGPMSRKQPTQLELEKENAELKRDNYQLRKRLKRMVRQLQQYEDLTELKEVLAEEIPGLNEEIVQEEVQRVNDMFLTFTLPNGQVKQIRKRAAGE